MAPVFRCRDEAVPGSNPSTRGISMLHSFQRLFSRFLLHTWQAANQRCLQGRLHPPVFSIGKLGRNLGTWNPQTRTISICETLLATRSELEIEEVLKHEMAHQYADEILLTEPGAKETAHGSAFRHACRLLDIEHQARLALTTTSSPLIRRIQKLLALGESHNPHEAEAALSKARELMEKYEIDPSHDEDPFHYQYLGLPKKQKTLVQQFLANILSRFFHVELVWIPSQQPVDQKSVWLLEANGTRSNLQIAAYVYEYLEHELARLWPQHRRAFSGLKGKTPKRDYQLGVLKGLITRLESESGRDPTGSQLVLQKKARLVQFFRGRHPHLRSGRKATYRQSSTFDEGYRKGRTLDIRKGIVGQEEKTESLPGRRTLGPGS